MFKNMAEFWDIVIFAFLFMMLASWQLSSAGFLQALVAIAAIVCCVGLLYAKKWALIGTYIVLIAGIMVCFGDIFYQPIVTGEASRVLPNIVKTIVAVLLFLYVGRGRVEARFS
jgi:hypothetical protein